MASWGSYVFELCRINANQGLTAEIDWNYTSWSRRCRKILIGLVVRGAKTVVVRGKNRILTRNRKKPEMTVPISQKKNRKGSVTSTVMGNTNSVVWRLYFYLHGEKYRCTGRDFFNWLPASP